MRYFMTPNETNNKTHAKIYIPTNFNGIIIYVDNWFMPVERDKLDLSILKITNRYNRLSIGEKIPKVKNADRSLLSSLKYAFKYEVPKRAKLLSDKARPVVYILEFYNKGRLFEQMSLITDSKVATSDNFVSFMLDLLFIARYSEGESKTIIYSIGSCTDENYYKPLIDIESVKFYTEHLAGDLDQYTYIIPPGFMPVISTFIILNGMNSIVYQSYFTSTTSTEVSAYVGNVCEVVRSSAKNIEHNDYDLLIYRGNNIMFYDPLNPQFKPSYELVLITEKDIIK